MNYAVEKIVNGNFSIDSEWAENLKGAIVRFHDVCKTLWNADDVQKATIRIIDEYGNLFEGYKEIIKPVQA